MRTSASVNSHSTRFRILKLFLLFVFLMVCGWLVGYGWFIVYTQNLRWERPTSPMDAIVVLTGGSNRIEQGLHLLDTGYAQHLFITGVNVNVDMKDIESIWDREKNAGVIDPEDRLEIPCCIALGRRAQNTRQNAKETAEWMKEKDVYSFILVTSNYHIPRAMLEFKAAMPKTKIHVDPISDDVIPEKRAAEDDIAVKEPFYQVIISKSNQKLFKEYNKLLLTWLYIKIF